MNPHAENIETHSEQVLDQDFLGQLPVYPLIHNIKQDVKENIDTALTWEQMTASDVNFAVIRPLIYKYSTFHNMAVVPACLFVRSHFLGLAEESLIHEPLHTSRAALCELLAMKLLRFFSKDQLELTAVLTTAWNPLAGASRSVVDYVQRLMGDNEAYVPDGTSTLELAIGTKSKRFLASALVQSVMEGIYTGRIVFSTLSTHSVLADNYKIKSIEIYDITKAPFLDHYRLRVPRYRLILDFLRFGVLLLTYILCISYGMPDQWSSAEVVFITFATAFVFDEYTACLEYGWSMYIANLWNVFDSAWIAVYLCYLCLRLWGMTMDDVETSQYAFDVLACSASILFPRLAFFAISNQVIILALRGMIAEFAVFISMAAVCFSGILFSLWVLATSQPEPKWRVQSIAWLMTQLWFGNSYLSFSQAESFHPLFGPVLMIIFAALSNTLLLTILISILSNTFMKISANANQEYLFQFSIRTIENVKSDAMFSYQPPFNLLAFIILRPLSWLLTPRSLHRVNVALIRMTSFPVLTLIAIYERSIMKRNPFASRSVSSRNFALYRRIPRRMATVSLFDTFTGSRFGHLMQAIFHADDELPHERELFHDLSADELVNLPTTPTKHPRGRIGSLTTSPLQNFAPLRVARSKSRASLKLEDPPEASSLLPSFTTPLARLFSGSVQQPDSANKPLTSQIHLADAEQELSNRLERIDTTVANFDSTQLLSEIRNLKERQARIEDLLVTLTKNLRGLGEEGKRDS